MTVRGRLLRLTLVTTLSLGIALTLGIAAILGACHFVCEGARKYEFAFVSDSIGSTELIVMPSDWTDYQSATCNDAQDDDPALSSDGRRLAFASDRSGDWEIYLLLARKCIGPRSTDSPVSRLTDAPGVDRNPAWSPNGASLAFESERTGLSQIFLMDRDGSNQRQLTFGDVESHAPVWSPDGSRIAFHARSEPGGTFDIFAVDLAGTDRRRITSSPGNDTSPAWAPKSQIAFVSDRDGDDHIYVVDVTTLDAVRVTSGPGREIDPTWCRAEYYRDRDPGGNDLCYAGYRDGQWGIYVGNAAHNMVGGYWNSTSLAYPADVAR